MAPGQALSLASQLPQILAAYMRCVRHIDHCGSWLASDGAGTVGPKLPRYKNPAIPPVFSRTLHKMPLVATPRDGLK